MGEIFGGGLTTIEVTAPHGRKRIIDKEEIEREIIKANQIKLMVANSTPLRQEPIQDLLGEQGDIVKWEKILRGEIDLPLNTERPVQLWMDKTKHPLQPAEEIRWTDCEYFQGWKK